MYVHMYVCMRVFVFVLNVHIFNHEPIQYVFIHRTISKVRINFNSDN